MISESRIQAHDGQNSRRCVGGSMSNHFKEALSHFQISINNCRPTSSGKFTHEDANVVNLNTGLKHLTRAIEEELESMQQRLAALEKRLPQ
jgi:hypothetical protein